jgi:hypothetical protein
MGLTNRLNIIKNIGELKGFPMEFQHDEMKERIDSFKYFRGIEPSSGRRGTTFIEPGYVYAPYIPIMTTARVEGNINPSQMIGSRYAMRMVNNSFYGTMIIHDYYYNEDD